MRNLNKVRFEASPYRTAELRRNPNILESRQFEPFLRMYLEDRRDQLRDCVRATMKTSPNPTEYFGLSFVPLGASSEERTFAKLGQVVVERGSIPLAAGDEECLRRLFSSFQVPVTPPLSRTRVTYDLCFSHSL